MAESSIDDTSWVPWVVAPGSGFEVRDPRGAVSLLQINRSQFLVTQAFRFSDHSVEQRLLGELMNDGMDAEQRGRAVDDARSFTPSENPSDLASIPRFMRWFESAYGRTRWPQCCMTISSWANRTADRWAATRSPTRSSGR